MLRSLTNPWIGTDGYDCFACNPHNPIGLKMKFWVDTDTDNVISIVPLSSHHQGWTDTLHGGLQATMMDEICSWQIHYRLGTSGVTSTLNMHYHHPVDTRLPYVVVRVEITNRRRRIIDLHATLSTPDGTLCSEADAIFFCFPNAKVAEMHFAPCLATGDPISLEEAINKSLESRVYR